MTGNSNNNSSSLLTLLVIAGLALIFALVGARMFQRRPGIRQILAQRDHRAQKPIDPALFDYVEQPAIKIRLKHLYGVAAGCGDEILVSGDTSLLRFRSTGELIDSVALKSPARCVAAAGSGEIFLGMSDHVEVLGKDGKIRAVWSRISGKTIITSIAVSGDNVFVADAGMRLVWRFDLAGMLRGSINGKINGGPGFIVPSPYFDVLPAAGNRLWIVNPGRHWVQRFDFAGNPRGRWGRAGLEIDAFCGCCNPGNISMLADGSFVTSEKGVARVKIYGPDGKLRAVVAGPESFAPGTVGLDLAVDSRGRIMVLDPRAGMVRIFTRKKYEQK